MEEGTLTKGSFAPAALVRPELAHILGCVEMVVDPELTADRPITESFERGTVVVTLRDGSERRAAVLDPRGHPKAPLSDTELAEKFRDCASGILTPGATEAALAHLADFGELERVSELMATLD
jgi:2-methylcitrate dehydratase